MPGDKMELRILTMRARKLPVEEIAKQLSISAARVERAFRRQDKRKGAVPKAAQEQP